MATSVWIDVFSGRPNPSYSLSNDAEGELLARLARLKRTSSSRISDTRSHLFGVIRVLREGRNRALSFSCSRGLVDFQALPFSYVDEAGVGRFLLERAPKPALPRDVKALMLEYLSLEYSYLDREKATRRVVCNPVRTQDATAFSVDWGIEVTADGLANRQLCNNCYDYANQQLTDTYSQPGHGSGQIFQSVDCASITAAAVRDGLRSVPASEVSRIQKSRRGWFVALFVGEIAPGIPDYHWLKQDSSGCWSHKDGAAPPSDKDYANQKIKVAHKAMLIDAPGAALNKYPTFCGYFRTDKSVTIKGLGQAYGYCIPQW